MARNDRSDLALRWSKRWTLTHRILAVNIFALAILAGSLFYIDSFRSRLTAAAVTRAEVEARMIANIFAVAPESARAALIARMGTDTGNRLRIYGAGGAKLLDSWDGATPTYELRDPAEEAWHNQAARTLDNVVDAIVGARRPPIFAPPAEDVLSSWPEAREALSGQRLVSVLRRAPEGTPFISAAAPIGENGASVLLLTDNAREVRTVVRNERLTLAIIVITTIILSVLLSLFLARTIALPLRRLARAAHQVRMGRAREVSVPLLPARRDEIGLLARALHDMTHSLRTRIDATEGFAADVTHELKNPLASLRSAVDALDRIEDPALRGRLLRVVRDDVMRLDRLVVEIADLSRLDAELSRARFEPIDLGRLIETMLPMWEERARDRGVRIAFARPRSGSALVAGDEQRLARVIDNIVDNALSFSPPEGLVEISASPVGEEVLLSIEDEGPGVPLEEREAIFTRFHSVRPDAPFGSHSGLGLAIARAIVEGHDGNIEVEERFDHRSGARFTIRFPGAPR